LLAFRVWAWDRGIPTALWSLNAKPPRRTQRRGQLRRLLATPEGAWPTDGPLVAKCDQQNKDDEPHQPPDPKCTCGIYAASSIEVVADYIREAPVLGLVQGGGTTVPGDFGFRAKEVRIVALFDIEPEFTIPRRDLKRLADSYGVPLVRPYSAQPDEYRKDVRDGFSRFKKEEEER
jgi:hypothetical protein